MQHPISHPPSGEGGPTYLIDHLEEVATRCSNLVPEETQTVGDGSLSNFLRVLGLCHDAGKATTWFQTYIDPERGAPEESKAHSLFGAYLGYYSLECIGFDPIDCLAGFVAVAKHHGRLPDTDDYVEYAARENPYDPSASEHIDDVKRQVENVHEHSEGFARDLLGTITNEAGSWSEFRTRMADGSLPAKVYKHVDERGFDPTRPRPSSGFYETVLQAWSALVFADKTSAASLPEDAYGGTAPAEQTLTSYIHELQDQPSSSDLERELNEARAEARQSVLDQADEFIEDGAAVATLTLPTGLGKTLTGLNAAFEIRDALDGERVVYALPFTSIIDQVSSDIQEIFDADTRGDLLTVHHHLSETRTSLSDEEASAGDDDSTDSEARLESMVAESWRSGVTVTTFVQLFESLAGPGNTQSMKLPALYNSVIVLDEPQALPTHWWKIVRRLVDLLTTEYDATVIAMTATQPKLFDTAFELVDDPARYFDRFQRVEYQVDPSVWEYAEGNSVEYADAAERLLDSFGEDCHSTLAVCNTIDSAISLTDAVSERSEPVDVGEIYADWIRSEDDLDTLANDIDRSCADGSFALAHLTSRVRPIDRLRLISVIKELTDRGVPILVISTQIIEAGVDVSFDAVFRDLAPIDSVVQAAGRCNRSFEREMGTVTLWWLSQPPGGTLSPAKAVYDREGVSTASITVQTLESIEAGETTIPESTMTTTCVDTYYENLHKRDPGVEAYVDYVDDALVEELGRLSLIDQQRAFDVVVCRTGEDRALVERAEEAYVQGEFDEFETMRRSLAERVVSVPIYRTDSSEAKAMGVLESLFPDSDRLVLDVEQAHLASYFDPTTGLVAPDTTIDARFL